MKVAIIGGGPAGMNAGIYASSCGADVTIFEKNEKLGKKMYISGKGRCNVTNDCTLVDFVGNVATNPKFTMGVISKFTPQDTIDFCNNCGVPVKVERGNRVFPCSDKSSDVIKAFTKQLEKNNVHVLLNGNVLQVSKVDDKFIVSTSSANYSFDRVIIATGGVSYKATGSTGDGYKFATSLGHDIVPTKPALCRLLCKGVAPLEGLSLKNVVVGLLDVNGNVVDSEFGEMLFANNAVSGPAVLTLSSRINKRHNENCKLFIDLKPALNEEKLNIRIVRDFAERMNKDFINSLDALLPERLIRAVALQSNIPFDKKVHQITQQERHSLVQAIKCLTFDYIGLDDIDYGIVTSGGVDVKQVNPSTMESKLVKGLYFAGEVLDVDAFTGGFNIQFALSSGCVAGTNSAK